MKSTLVIARRELAERQFVFLAAAALAALSIIIPIIPVVHAGSRREAIAVLSAIFAGGFALILSAVLGSSIVGRELSERRLSFYFSKPIPGAAIWLGKVIASVALIALTTAMIVTPALVAGIDPIVRTFVETESPILNIAFQTAFGTAIVLGVPLEVFFLAHVIGTFVRSRSAWIVVDFIAAAICIEALAVFDEQLRSGFAFGLIHSVGLAFVAFVAAAILVAGAWQLAFGRADAVRSHRALSRFLWTAIGGGVLILAVYVAWVVSVSPADLRPDRFFARSSGRWFVLGGSTKHRDGYFAAFLYNADSGRAVRIAPNAIWTALLNHTSVAFWEVPYGEVDELRFARLNDDPKPVKTSITLRRGAFFNFSDDGTRVMAIEPGGLMTVYDAETSRSLGSVRIPGGDYWVGYFVNPAGVRIYAHSRSNNSIATIFEYDIARRQIARTGSLSLPWFRLRFDRAHALVAGQIGNALEIFDAHSGAALHSIPGTFPTFRFLDDGRIAAIDRESRLRIFTANGVEARNVGVPPRSDGIYDIGGDRVVVRVRPSSAAIVDIVRGTVRVVPGLLPAPGEMEVPGENGSRLLCRAPSGIVVWNPATGQQRLISRS